MDRLEHRRCRLRNLCRACCLGATGSRRTQMRTAQVSPSRVSSLIGDPASIEFVRCRSDLFNRSFVVAVVLVEGVVVAPLCRFESHQGVLKSSSRVNTAHHARGLAASVPRRLFPDLLLADLHGIHSHIAQRVAAAHWLPWRPESQHAQVRVPGPGMPPRRLLPPLAFEVRSRATAQTARHMLACESRLCHLARRPRGRCAAWHRPPARGSRGLRAICRSHQPMPSSRSRHCSMSRSIARRFDPRHHVVRPRSTQPVQA